MISLQQLKLKEGIVIDCMKIKATPMQVVILFAYSFVLFLVGVYLSSGANVSLRATISGIGGFGMGVAFFIGMIMLRERNNNNNNNDNDDDDDYYDDFHDRINKK